MSLPDVPQNLDWGLYQFLIEIKEAIERLDGEKRPKDKAMTYQDAIDIGLIDENFEKI